MAPAKLHQQGLTPITGAQPSRKHNHCDGGVELLILGSLRLFLQPDTEDPVYLLPCRKMLTVLSLRCGIQVPTLVLCVLESSSLGPIHPLFTLLYILSSLF